MGKNRRIIKDRVPNIVTEVYCLQDYFRYKMAESR